MAENADSTLGTEFGGALAENVMFVEGEDEIKAREMTEETKGQERSRTVLGSRPIETRG